MTQVEYLDFALGLVNAVIDEKRAVEQLSDVLPVSDQATHVRKSSQQLNVFNERIAEAEGGFRVVLGNVADDLGEIV